MFEDEIRKKGLVRAPDALTEPILRHARDQVSHEFHWLDVPLLRIVAGFVPFFDWAILATALVRGERVQILPVAPGLSRGD